MAYLLAYRFAPGDVLEYEHTTYLVVDEPEGARHVGKSVLSLQQRVLERIPAGYRVEVVQRVLESSGLLAEEANSERVSEFEMEPSGRLLGQTSTSTGFPREAVAEGQIWEQSAPGEPTTRFRLERVEEVEGDTLALVVSDSDFRRTEGGEELTVHLEALTLFSLTHGCQNRSQAAVQTRWPDGRLSQTAIETRLLRKSSPPGSGPAPG